MLFMNDISIVFTVCAATPRKVPNNLSDHGRCNDISAVGVRSTSVRTFALKHSYEFILISNAKRALER